MNDVPLSAPPPRRPRPPQQQARGRKAPPSQESRFIGYVVLGFGILAVATVLVLAFSGKSPDTGAPPDAQQVATLAAELPAVQQQVDRSPLPAVTPRPAPQPARDELAFKRQPAINAENVNGAWQSMIGKYTAVVQMDRGVYQIILASPDPNAARIYSSGTYQMLDDILTLNPRTDWPAPNPGAGRTVGYSILTRAEFSLLVGFQKGHMMWQNAPQSEKRVLTSLHSPLFLSEKVDYVVWQKLNR